MSKGGSPMRKYAPFITLAILALLLGSVSQTGAAQGGSGQAAAGKPAATATDCPNPFVDINGSVFYPAIHNLYCRGIVSGTDATHFNPSATITRAETAKVIALAFNYTLVSPTGGGQTFVDVPPSYWAFVYIETVFGPHCGITYCDLNFGPNLNYTRGQTMKTVVLAKAYPFSTPTTPTFVDVPTSYFAYLYIETAYAHGIIRGVDATHFYPNRTLRRDELCQIIEAALNNP